MDKVKKVPDLRFPGFEGEWEVKSIGKVLTIGSGRDYKHLSTGNIPVYGTGGYMLSVNNFLYDGESVCIGRKGTIDNPIFLSGKFWTVDTLFYTHSFKNSLPRFIYSYFQKVNWKNYNEASGVPSLSKSTIEKIDIRIPKLLEQQKIADFLSQVDKKIEQLTKKKQLLESYKKGAMQKIFSQELRFKDDKDEDYPDWEEKELGNIYNITSSKRVFQDEWTTSGVPFYRAREVIKLSESGYVENELYISNEMYEIYKSKYGVPKENDLLVTGVGTIGKLYVVKKDEKFYFKDGNIIWFKKLGEINSQFVKHLFRSRVVQKQIEDNASITTVGTYTIDSAKKTTIPFPCLEEQQKIANFLTEIDNKINHVTKQIEGTKQFKKGLLQKMFV